MPGIVCAQSTEANPKGAELLGLEMAGQKLAMDWLEARQNGDFGSLIGRREEPQQAGRTPWVALMNPWVSEEARSKTVAAQGLAEVKESPLVFERQDASRNPVKPLPAQYREAASVVDDELAPMPKLKDARDYNKDATGCPLLPCLFIDWRCVYAAKALDVQPGERVLDLCAGPGSKSLLLASMLFAPKDAQPTGPTTSGGLLVCNEPNKVRRAALEDMLRSFLPAELVQKNGSVVVTQFAVPPMSTSFKPEAAFRRYMPFDKILIDPPLHTQDGKIVYLLENLLRCGVDLLKPGGQLVYCPAAIEKPLCEDVIVRVAKRGGYQFDVHPVQESGINVMATTYGTEFRSQKGPLYISRLSCI